MAKDRHSELATVLGVQLLVGLSDDSEVSKDLYVDEDHGERWPLEEEFVFFPR